MRRRWSVAVLLLIGFGLVSPGSATAVSVNSGGMGDALIFQLIEVTNLDTLIAIESFSSRTQVHRVRFRNATVGATALEFELCLVPGETFTAGIRRDGSLTKVESPAMHRINGVLTQLNTTLSGNPTRAFLEVIGLRANASPSSDTAICADASIGGDATNAGLMGKVYYVAGASSPPLVYGTNAIALKDFSAVKIGNGSVFGNNAVALALIDEGIIGSLVFSTRYFVPASFAAVTQVVLTFPTGPNSVGCPNCRMPSTFAIIPFSEAGVALTQINLPSDTSVVRVISLTSADIANDAGLLDIFETGGSGSIPLVGFGINTTAPSALTFFNVLFPIAKE